LSRYGSSYGSPYSSGHTVKPRWPWVFGLCVVALIFASSGLLIADRLNRSGSAVEQVAQRITPESDQAGVVATEAPTPTTEPTIEPTTAPTPTEVDTQAPLRTAETWLALWSIGDYSSMYNLASKEVQASTSRDAFATRYAEIAEEAGLVAIAGEVVGQPDLNGNVTVDLTLESNLVGTINERNVIPLVREDGGWRVAWTPSLIFRQLGSNECIDFIGEIPQRGRILDRNGEILASDTEVARIGVIPAEISNMDATLSALSDLVGMAENDISAIIQNSDYDPSWFLPIADIPGEADANLINRAQNIEGVVVRRAVTRYYPQGALTAHITGWVSPATAEDVLNDDTGAVHQNEMVGRSGVEFGANELLAGKPGGALNVIDCESREIREEIARSAGTAPQDVYLTIDLEMQRQVDASLTAQESTDQREGLRGAAVYIDPRTGAILAMVSHPTFDPNDAVQNTYTEAERAMINDEELTPQLNRATRARYPTGSIFKSITYAAALHTLGYTGDTEIDCPQSFEIGTQRWNDWVVENGLSAQGMLTLHAGLVRSCNTVFYQLGAALDDEDPFALPEMARAFGLGEPTGIPYFPEIPGTVPDPTWKLEVVGDGWATGDAVNLAIGQGYLTATPLQMANAYAAIANGGHLLQPYIVDYTKTGDGEMTQIGERVVIHDLPLTADQIADLQSALAEQTHNSANVGSNKIFGDLDWPISGKTGTAQTETNDTPHSWFAAYGGADGEATIASVTLIENRGEGVSYAAPATRMVYDWYIQSGLAEETAPGSTTVASPATADATRND
jgi:penicillin-binding protein 2